jgi:hypothetical protein
MPNGPLLDVGSWWPSLSTHTGGWKLWTRCFLALMSIIPAPFIHVRAAPSPSGEEIQSCSWRLCCCPGAWLSSDRY